MIIKCHQQYQQFTYLLNVTVVQVSGLHLCHRCLGSHPRTCNNIAQWRATKACLAAFTIPPA